MNFLSPVPQLCFVLPVRNVATRDGGGIRAVLGSVTSQGSSLFSGNSATGNGGAIYGENSPLSLSTTTFANNVGNLGGAVRYSTGSTMVVQNCVYSGNRATQGGGISAAASSSLTVSGTVVWHRLCSFDEWKLLKVSCIDDL